MSFGYTGEQTDGNGLLYLRARYYAPSQGRFFQLDPSRQEVNLYAYVAGNPVNLVDPSGLTVPVPPCHGPKWYCRLIGRTPTGVASTATLTPSFTPADAAGRLVLLLLGATCTAILPDVVDANTGILPGPRLTVPDLSAGYYPFPLYNEDRGMVILSFPLYSPEAGTIYLPFPLVAPNEVPALLEGPRSVEQSINDMLLLATYGQAKHALQQGATEVKVSTRAEAEQLFYEIFVVGDPRHYRNTTGMTSAEANRFFGTRAGTYHWDEDLSRHLNEEHSKYPHLQIHTFEGDIIRIYFEKVD